MFLNLNLLCKSSRYFKGIFSSFFFNFMYKNTLELGIELTRYNTTNSKDDCIYG